MEILIVGAIAGVFLALVILWIVWRAVGNAIDWLIYTFGNENAARRIEQKWAEDLKARKDDGRD
jgi:hypothetical protein